jgi:hypothetical protein
MTGLTSDPPAVASMRSGLLASTAFSLGLLWILAFEEPFSDFPEGLLIFAMVLVIGLPFLGCCIWSVFLLRRIRQGGKKFAVPLMVCTLTVVLLASVPFAELWLQRNFWWYRADRERIVARVEAGELKPNVSYNSTLIALGDTEPSVSVGGNDIVVEQTETGTYVLFLTLRGFRHYFSGFLHVPPGGDPAGFFEFEDKPPRRIVQYGKDWYFVAN